MKGLKYILMIALLAGGLLPVATGRVFRGRGVPEGRLNTAGLSWEFAYHTVMNVNGRKNDVYLYSARFDEPVREQLQRQLEAQGAKVSLQKTADGATGIAKWSGGEEARLLVLSPSTQPNQMIFLFYPEVGVAKSSPRLPIPNYPGGVVGNTVVNEGTKTYCSTVKTADRADQVQAFYAGELAANGWTAVVPGSLERGAAGGMMTYHKRNKVCCVMAVDQPEGLCRLTLLVKDSGL
jgi:hypothetical protein